MIRKNCFGYKRHNYCLVLTEMVCKDKNCTFYKTKQEFQEGLDRTPIKKQTITAEIPIFH